MGGRTLTEIIEQVLDNNGQLKPGFSGIGRLRGKSGKDYTQDERTVLEYFFTNTHSNIYCATDNMPNELWALVMGQYARSNLTGRDRLLQLFHDMHDKQKEASVAELAEMIKSGKDLSSLLVKHLNKAGVFIDTWGVKYGHASLRDSGTIRVCCEGVSQRATKFLEAAREGAYQEQSTRALPFTAENLGIPYEVRGTKYEKILLDLDRRLIELYERVYAKLLEHLDSKFAHKRAEADEQIQAALGRKDVKMRERSWEGIIKSKAFDVARYLLPQNMTTSLGITLNTRRFQDMLTAWQSDEIMEMQVLGAVIQAEARKISPTLMKYGNRSEYHANIGPTLRALHRKFAEAAGAGRQFSYQHYDCVSTLIEAPDDLQDLVLASILLNGGDGRAGIDELKEVVGKLKFEEKREIARAVTEGKLRYDIFHKAPEIGAVVFERIYDIGAFRDLQRQRGDRQQYNRYSVIGYNMPKEIDEIGMKAEFVAIMHDVKEVYDTLKKEGMHAAAEYVPVMANVLRHVSTKDPVQCFYEAGLRTQPAGIDSYRSIAQQEIRKLLEMMPVFKGLVPFDDTYHDLGRLPETVRMEIDHFRDQINKGKL
ncbi:FAD-dependent thymidylate synthase [Candidatus Woesearchaeota archaeon]|nr:FAD-dependent thymidylate synthase [Candidatus Woesearchaeota archaeon]